MSEITAVVLSLGEGTTSRAIESVERQTVPARDIIRVNDVTPFHKALNRGATQVATRYFCQVDADMVLDDDCFERLLEAMDSGVGIVGGYLRDPLIGKVSCVKIFRRACFDAVRFEDSISPDTDFAARIRRHGWTAVFGLRFEGPREVWHTFGSHLPDYSPRYTFRKYMLEGRRYVYRGDLRALVWHLDRLKNSDHPVSFVAEIAMAHGIFREDDRDLLGRTEIDLDFGIVEQLLSDEGSHEKCPIPWRALDGSPQRVFHSYFELGTRMRRIGAGSALQSCARELHGSSHINAWLARVALFHGIFSTEVVPGAVEGDFDVLGPLLDSIRRSR